MKVVIKIPDAADGIDRQSREALEDAICRAAHMTALLKLAVAEVLFRSADAAPAKVERELIDFAAMEAEAYAAMAREQFYSTVVNGKREHEE